MDTNDSDDLVVLRAKARVCDAYRRWLISPRRAVRSAVCEALEDLERIEHARREPPRVAQRRVAARRTIPTKSRRQP